MTSKAVTVSVVICAYTEERWGTMVAALNSARDQLRPADQILIVIDHNDLLLRRAAVAFPEAQVVKNLAETRGIAGARNTGIHHSTCDVVAYLDDDAVAEPDWLVELLAPYEDPAVIGTGSRIDPVWSGRKPGWFPDEFGWVVGCSYRGQPEVVAPVRNFIANGMSLRKECLAEAGPFLTDIGRIGAVPLGCEETELCIRVRKHFPGRELVHVPTARVRHDVPARRCTVSYFMRRCFAEGLSKDAVSRYAGAGAALATEREYVLKALPSGMARGLRKAARGEVSGAGEALMILVGLCVTAAGYLAGRSGVFSKLVAIWGDRSVRGRNRPRVMVFPDEPRPVAADDDQLRAR
jgi:GT2 family glycosyltransferase